MAWLARCARPSTPAWTTGWPPTPSTSPGHCASRSTSRRSSTRSTRTPRESPTAPTNSSRSPSSSDPSLAAGRPRRRPARRTEQPGSTPATRRCNSSPPRPADALPDATAERAWTRSWAPSSAEAHLNPHVDDPTSEPLTQAINRPSMRALDVAFAAGGSVGRTPTCWTSSKTPSRSRAPTASRPARSSPGASIGCARQRPTGSRDARASSSAPTPPAAWARRPSTSTSSGARPNRDLAIEQRDAIVAALGRARHEEAVQHLLLGLQHELPGYDLEIVAGGLVDAGDREVSYAGQWIGLGPGRRRPRRARRADARALA